MDRLSGLDARRVMHTLSSDLEKERLYWKPADAKQSSAQDAGFQRNELAASIVRLSSQFKFQSETCGLAIMLLDRVQQLFKVQAKYMPCVTVTCLSLAAKTLEEDENIPSTPELVKKSFCGCSYAEITRMEMVLLNKLNWNVKQPSAVDFLHTLHAVLTMHYPHLLSGSSVTPAEQLCRLMRQMLRCLTSDLCLRFRPSTLALGLLSLELEALTPGWLRLVHAVQLMTNVGSEQLMACRVAIADLIGSELGRQEPARTNRKSSSSAPKSKKRKVEHPRGSGASSPVRCVMDDEVYEAIRNLYKEDSSGKLAVKKPALKSSCSLEMQQHQDHPENVLTTPLAVS